MENSNSTAGGLEAATGMARRERDKIWEFMSGKPAYLGSAAGLTHFHYLRLVLDAGDVLVFMDLPEQIAFNSSKATDCNGIAYRSQQFRAHSEKLFKLEGSKFTEMLENEIYQARVRRRRKPPPNMLEGIKYLLDLTPASEGEDIVFQMAEMSLPPGVDKWWSTTILNGAPLHFVDGHDDVCSCHLELWDSEQGGLLDTQTDGGRRSEESVDNAAAEVDVPSQKPSSATLEDLPTKPTPEKLLTMQMMGENELYKTPYYRNIPDYCRIRHCNSIIRLLMMIEGHNVDINSAPRVWSLVAIAKIFECPSVVRDKVNDWIVCQPHFIEILPEVALRIGYALELPNVARMAFRVLVNELALEEAAGTDGFRHSNKHVTVFGRRKDDVPDEMQNVIQHAAREFTDRIMAQYAEFTDPKEMDPLEAKIFKRMCTIEQLLEQESGTEAKQALFSLRFVLASFSKGFTKMMMLAMDNPSPFNGQLGAIDHERASYVKPEDFSRVITIMSAFNMKQRLLCTFIYQNILRISLMDMSMPDHLASVDLSIFEAIPDLTELPSTKNGRFADWMELTDASLTSFLVYKPYIRLKPEWNAILSDGGANNSAQILEDPCFDTKGLAWIFTRKIERFSRPCARGYTEPEFGPFRDIARHMLLTLDNSNEMKFLPLWAGGCDDGSGGVFESFLPPAEMGPNGPGPAYHTGLTIPSAPSTLSDSLLDDIRGLGFKGSTTAGSIDVRDSMSTAHDPNEVILADSSIASEEFSKNSIDYKEARFDIPSHRDSACNPLGDIVVVVVDDDDDDNDDNDDDEADMEFYADDDDVMSDATEVAHVSELGEDDELKELDVRSVSSKASDLSTDSDSESIVMV